MKQKTKPLKNLMLAAAASLGFAATAFAQDPAKAPPNPAAPAMPTGLLGSSYAGVTWHYLDLHGGPPGVAHGASADVNVALAPRLDLGVGYDWLRARAGGVSSYEDKLDLSLTGYLRQGWGTPYFKAGTGYAWRHGTFAGRRGSWGVAAEAGAEFAVAPAFAVAPFVAWDRETGFNRNQLHYGARASWRVTREWSVTAAARYIDATRAVDRGVYSLGVNYHF